MPQADDSRKLIGEAVQQALHTEQAGEAQGNFVTGWVLVAESMAPDGRRWLSRVSADASFENLTSWAQQGLLHNALHDDGWDDDAPS